MDRVDIKWYRVPLASQLLDIKRRFHVLVLSGRWLGFPHTFLLLFFSFGKHIFLLFIRLLGYIIPYILCC